MKPRGRPKKNKIDPPEAETPIQQELRNFVDRIERMEDEKIMAQKTILDIYAEAKEQGISTSILREIIRLRKFAPNEREAYEALRNMYMQAIGLKS